MWRLPIRALALTLLAADCSGGAEQPIIGQFFSASRLLDYTSLGHVATIVFDPRTQGTVRSFTIQSVSREQNGVKEVTIVAPVRLPDGATAQKTLVITMQRATAPPRTASSWMITRVRLNE